MPSNKTLLLTILIAVTISIAIIGCGGSGMREGTMDYEKVNLPPGALPDVSAEMGGEGFTGEGWETNMDYEAVGDPRAVRGGTFTTALFSFPSTLRNIGKDSNTELNFLIENMIYESLIGFHSMDMSVIPGLATHWKISDDKTTFTFRINPEARFADGSRVTAEDVVASWKIRVDPGILSPYSNFLWGQYEEPKALSPYIVEVTAKQLNWRYFIYFGGMSVMPAKYISHLSGTEYLREFQFVMPPGSGSYEIAPKGIDKGRSISLIRREGYWDENNPKGEGLSNFDLIKFVVIKDERLMFEKFKKGELDFYQVGRAQWWIEETDFEAVRRGLVQKRRIYNDDPQGFMGFVFNMREEPFNDIRVRQAFTHLFDREKMIERLFFSEYMPLDSYFPGSIYENPNNPKYRYDPDRAVKLLAEVGWKDRNAEGLLVDKNGKPFELSLTFASAGQERYLTVFQEDLRKVGIKLELKQADPATMFKMVQEHNFQIHFQNWGGLLFPNPENSWASWIADDQNTNNLAGVKNDRIDQLCREYDTTFVFERRVEIIQEIDGILMEIQPYALGWYAPFHRILYWNKFSHPDFYFARTGDWRSILGYWWIDPDKERVLKQGMKDKNVTMPVGETEVLYWIKYNEEHGRSYEIKGL